MYCVDNDVCIHIARAHVLKAVLLNHSRPAAEERKKNGHERSEEKRMEMYDEEGSYKYYINFTSLYIEPN